MRVLIAGCGYVGTATGALLVRAGHEVVGLTRSEDETQELGSAGIIAATGDLTQLESLNQLRGKFNWVVNTVSSSRGGADSYRKVYLEGTQVLLTWLKAHPIEKYVYTSSTSVYGQMDGSTVDETSPATPGTETGDLLRQTEELLMEAARNGFPSVILRVAGIYGPHRGHLFRQFLNGEARLAADGARWMNMIHRDDVARAIVAALERGKPGALYNCADDEPVSQHRFLEWLSGQLNLPMPSHGTEEPPPTRKRGISHKRVGNQRLKSELAWTPQFPTFREGYAAEIHAVREQRFRPTEHAVPLPA